MLRIIFTLLIAFNSLFAFAQIDAVFNHKTFNSPNGTYLETYIYLYANTLRYVPNEENVPKCAVEITQLIKLKDSIVTFQKYTLINPEKSINEVYEDLVDVKRFPLKNNTQYELEIIIKDKNNPRGTEQSISKTIKIDYRTDYVELSDIELVSGYNTSTTESILTKSGIDMIPMVSDYYSTDFEKIVYYFEVYNAPLTLGKNGRFVINHYIENTKTNTVAGTYQKTVRGNSDEIIPILYYFDIQSLPSGTYNIVAQVKNEYNEVVIEKKTSFVRANNNINMSIEFLRDVEIENSFVARMHADSLLEYIHCLAPITQAMENRMIDNQVNGFTEQEKRQFIYSFWNNQDHSNPELAWEKYYEQVKLVHQMFGTKVRRGYETDRGRIYLRYGPPNNVEDRPNEPSAYPYQIWHYYKIGQFNNKRFVFYLPDLVSNDYVMLHSDLQGEFQNYKWERDLQKRNTRLGNIDDPNEGNYDSYGNRSGVLFRNP
jgi:GWxTD domain-containing protein